MADGTVGSGRDDGSAEHVAIPLLLGAPGRAATDGDPADPPGAPAAVDATSSEPTSAVAGDVPVIASEGWTAPAVSTSHPREQWSMLALVAAVIGLVPVTWPVPILSVLGVAFGLIGIRNCQLDRVWRNRWMAVLALGLGLATLTAALLLTSFGKLHFLPFWTTSN